MGKRIVSLLLAFVLVLSYVPQIQAEATAPTITGISATVAETLIQGQHSVPQKISVNDQMMDVEVYDFGRLNPIITVHYSDGSEIPYAYADIEKITGYGAGLDVAWGDAAKGGIWTVGGKNNLITVYWNEFSCTVPVTVVENPVSSVSMTISEPYIIGLNSSEMCKWDDATQQEISWVGYDPMYYNEGAQFVINYKNGSSQTLLTRQIYETFQEGPVFSIGKEQESWTAGQYEVAGRFLGCDFTVTMALHNNPVKSFRVETEGTFTAGQMQEQWNPTTGENYAAYDPSMLVTKVIVTTSNDQIDEYAPDALSSAFRDSISYITDQHITPWGVGTHTVTAEFMGKEYTFQVEVVADPVKSVSIESPISMTQGLDTSTITNWTENGPEEITGIYNVLTMNPTITVNYANGQKISAPADRIGELVGGEISCHKDFAVTASWKPGNTYDWELELLGHKFTAKINVLANPVAKVEVDKASIKYSRGNNQPYWDEQTQQEIWLRAYNLHEADITVTVTYTDGTKKTMSYMELAELDDDTHINAVQSPENLWQPGNSYPATLVALGHNVDFKVSVVDDRVKELKVTPTKPLYYGITGWAEFLVNTRPSIHVTLADGTTLAGDFGLLYDQLYVYEKEYGIEGGDENGKLSVGKHTGYMIIDGVKATFTVEVLENTIKHVEVIPANDLVQNVHGSPAFGMGENEELLEYFNYDLSTLACTYKITYQDGSTKTFADAQAVYEMYGEHPQPYIAQTYANQLKLGENKVKVFVLGAEYENTITLVKNPIKSVSAAYTKDLIEGVNCRWEPIWDWNTSEFLGERAYYDLEWDRVLFTLTYENGTQEILSASSSLLGSDLYTLCGYSMQESDQEDNEWKAGKHKWTVTALGHTFDVPVTIVKNTITKVSAKATQNLIQDWHKMSYDNGQTWCYDLWYSMPEVTLTFTDGSTKTYTYTQLCDAYSSVSFCDLPVGTPGTKTATLSVNNVECEFEVKVVENPVKSITAVPTTTLKENYLGTVSLYYPGYGDCTFQSYVPADTIPIYTITFKDGTTQVLHGDHQVFDAYSLYPNYLSDYGTPDKPYSVGKYTIQLELLGHTVDYSFEIVKDDNPLEKITAKPVGQLYENVYPYGYQYYYYGNLIEVTLHYKDGTTKTGISDSILPSTSRLMIEYADSQDEGEQWGIGKHKVTVKYKNLETETEIEVVKNPYKALQIAGGKDGLTVTLTTEAGTKEVQAAKRFKMLGWDGSSMYSGTLVTDKGSYFVSFCIMNGKILYMDYQGLRSNKLETDSWLQKQMETEIVGDLPDIQLSYDEGDLTELVLTDGDKMNGYNRAWLIAEELSGSLSADDKALLDEAMKKLENYNSGLLLDLGIYKDGGFHGTMKVGSLSKAVTITIPLENLDGTNKLFKMLRIHNGEVEELNCTYDAATNSISFLTDRFSTYSMVYVDALSSGSGTAGDAATPPATNPATGDATPVALLSGLALASVVALAVLWLTERKKRAA